MNIIEKIFLAIKTIILFFGFIPSGVNGIFYMHWLLTIIIFGLFLYIVFKKCYKSAYKYAILTIIFSIASYISLTSSKGTSDNFEGLHGVVNSLLLASLFALLEIISFIMLLISNHRAKTEETILKAMEEEITVDKPDGFIQCPGCGTWIKQYDDFCNKCGIKLH